MNTKLLMKSLQHTAAALLFSLGALTLTTHAAETNATQATTSNPSPYTLEQIQAHLTEMYRFDLEAGNGLKRWDEPELIYGVGGKKGALSEAEKKIIKDIMTKYGTIVGKPIKHGRKGNILLIYTDEFLQTLLHSGVRRLLFPGYNDEAFSEIYTQFVKTGQTSYGVLRQTKDSKKINRMYVLDEVNDQLRSRLKQWSEFASFETFSLREKSGQSNVIKPSIVNIGDGNFGTPHAGILQPIDRFYLEALYSDKIYYGMPIKEAIKIMSNMIHQKLGGE